MRQELAAALAVLMTGLVPAPAHARLAELLPLRTPVDESVVLMRPAASAGADVGEVLAPPAYGAAVGALVGLLFKSEEWTAVPVHATPHAAAPRRGLAFSFSVRGGR